ncbi:hypothetical protein F0562_012924 [Nyssa sinensis]|uniref:Bifunctional inhibitor/plant lipid transfer protein/seed storage helical domain-containing protein n=1 Tax=Nyssa sinensis TaxID=561372 RepID=A0A5J4ZYV7_9ASTE|nr:hypothetical protein F0562_012924 [Nyssa sinensis]
MSRLSEMGMLRLMPRMLAFKAVQRQTAASRSMSPPSKEQQGASGGVPTTAPTVPLSTFAHTPSFRASLGQLPVEGGGVGLGFGVGFGGLGGLHALTRVKKRMLTRRKRAADEQLLESISQPSGQSTTAGAGREMCLVVIVKTISNVHCGCSNCPSPSPSPSPRPSPSKAVCPRDALKFSVCANVLNGLLLGVVVGTPPRTRCCSLIVGLVDLEAAICLCTVIKANVLGINLNIPLSLSLLLSACQKVVPSEFKCA